MNVKALRRVSTAEGWGARRLAHRRICSSFVLEDSLGGILTFGWCAL